DGLGRRDLRHAGPQLGLDAGGFARAPAHGERDRDHEPQGHEEGEHQPPPHALRRPPHPHVAIQHRVGHVPPDFTDSPIRCTPALRKGAITLTTASYLTDLSAEMTTGVSALPPWASFTRAAMLRSGTVCASLPSRRIFTDSSEPTTTSITCSGRCLLLPTEGRSTSPVVMSGALTMKMMSSTSITSMNGTMLISLIVRRRPLPRWLTAGMACLASAPARR